MSGTLDDLKENYEYVFGEKRTFFFESVDEVQGYWGTGKVWFLAQKPSENPEGFPTRNDRFFYNTLSEYGFENAHLTDISKIAGAGGTEITEYELKAQLPFLRCELDLTDPDLIVTVGQKAKSTVDSLKIFDNFDQTHVPHYTWGETYGNQVEVKESFANVAENVD